MRAAKNLASILLFMIGGVIAVAVVGVIVHLWNYAQFRRRRILSQRSRCPKASAQSSRFGVGSSTR